MASTSPEDDNVPAEHCCEWYLLCFRLAVGVVDHPILGPVRICEPCARKHHLLGAVRKEDV